VGSRGAHAIARLTKRDVEALLTTYDDDPVGALTTALRVVLDRPTAAVGELLAAAGLDRSALDDVTSRDRLVRDLNELRDLPR
jgi:hypothetical protein